MKNYNIISVVCYLSVLMNIFIFSYILVFNPIILKQVFKEDSIVENLQFLLLLLSSFLLFLSSYVCFKQRPKLKPQFILFITTGVLFFMAAGEEISWGQRIFSINTPEIMLGINQQNELNFHNFDTKFFTRLFRHSISLFVLLATIAFFSKKDRMFGMKMPDVAIIFSVILLSSYYHYSHFNPEFHLISWMALFAFLIYFIKKRETNGLVLTIVTILVIIFIILLHVNFNQRFKVNDTNETQEYLLSMVSFFYSAFLLLDVKLHAKCSKP